MGGCAGSKCRTGRAGGRSRDRHRRCSCPRSHSPSRARSHHRRAGSGRKRSCGWTFDTAVQKVAEALSVDPKGVPDCIAVHRPRRRSRASGCPAAWCSGRLGTSRPGRLARGCFSPRPRAARLAARPLRRSRWRSTPGQPLGRTPAHRTGVWRLVPCRRTRTRTRY